MNKYLKIALGAASVALFTGCHSTKNITKSTIDDKSIVVVYDNDVHCAYEGYSKFAGFRDAIAASDTAWVATASSGDYIQGGFAGAVSDGNYIIDMMKSVGYDAVTLGNHEFDYSIDHLAKLLNNLGAPVTSVNFTEFGSKKPVYKAYVMKQMGSKKVAFIGALTPGTLQTESAAFFSGGKQTHDTNNATAIEMIQKAANDARSEGADYVILLSHLGEIETVHTKVTSHAVVAATRGINAVLDAHSHSAIPQLWLKNVDGDDVVLMQTGTQFANIGKLVIDKNGRCSTELIKTEDVSVTSAKVQATQDSIAKLLLQKEQQIIGHTSFPLSVENGEGDTKAIRHEETNLGDFAADAYRYVGNTEIALCNAGSIRKPMPSGNISYRSIVDVHPYTNNICTAEVKGQTLLDALEMASATTPAAFGGFLQASGLRYTIDTTVPSTLAYDNATSTIAVSGERRIKSVQVERTDANGNITWEDIDPSRTYTVTATDYVLYLGNETGVLRQSKIITDKMFLYSEALIKYLSEKLDGKIPDIYRTPQGRITVLK